MAYSQIIRVRFDEVDYARVVYFPNLFDYCHRVFEDFFGAEVGVPYAQMLCRRGVGFPTVNARADFRSPFRFGDDCRVVMEALELGNSSIRTRYRLHAAASEIVSAELELVAVSISMDRFQPVDTPDDVRAAFARHLAAG